MCASLSRSYTIGIRLPNASAALCRGAHAAGEGADCGDGGRYGLPDTHQEREGSGVLHTALVGRAR